MADDDGTDRAASCPGSDSGRDGGARTATDDRPRLLLDAMLGTLATYLRMCGYDAAYALDRGVEADDRLAALARAEGRTLVTRDAALAGRVDGSVLLTERDVVDQLRELRDAGFDLSLSEPRRCSSCNGRLERVAADSGEGPAAGPNPDDQPVCRCAECGQFFWKGSHWDDVRERIEGL